VIDQLLVLGASGDLAGRYLLPALAHLQEAGRLPQPLAIVGVACDDWDTAAFRRHLTAQLECHAATVDPVAREALVALASYQRADAGDAAALAGALDQAKGPVVAYLALPPAAFAPVIQALATVGLPDRSRVVVEKPLGRSLAEARALNQLLGRCFGEEATFRAGHFLGLQTVQNLLGLRFANRVLEPVWHAEHIQRVDIVWDETVALEGRAGYYDHAGALRDVVQNHLLQVMALIAMEPPAGNHPDPIRDEKLALLKAVRSADPKRYVRGQYEGYREIEGVDPSSTTETFVGLRLDINNWRWWGVPFFLRAGKCLAEKVTEVRVILKDPPPVGIGGRPTPESDELIVRIDPDPGASLLLEAKQTGEESLRRVHLDLLFNEQFGGQPGPYERLLSDALAGEQQRFAREDSVEETWRIVQPLIDRPCELETYSPGSWGPEGASNLLHGYGGWRRPWLPEAPFETVGAG
jgi:glucose-6-phosphate 1-dehydrogenase